MKLGTSYSHRHIKDIGIDEDLAVKELIDFGFDIVRLGCYWDEIEQIQGKFDFSKILGIVEQCEDKGQKVLMTIGMKSPRWPEYYIPGWLKSQSRAVNDLYPEVSIFITKSIQALKSFKCIDLWQVENEPMDPSGPDHLVISKEFLKKEVELVKSLDSRSVLINFWGNLLSKRDLMKNVVDFADVAGLDIYYKVPLKNFGYWGPLNSDRKLTKIIKNYPMPVWITELQAEPWEHNETFTKEAQPKSINADLLQANYDRATSLGVESVLFWGFEYWLWKKLNDDSRIWDIAKNIINLNK